MTEAAYTPQTVKHLVGPDGATIAYSYSPGKSPAVVFLSGYNSDMDGTKALALEEYCRARGNAFLRFDYFGHGRSEGDFREGTIGRWCEDTLLMIDEITEGPVILVGSSMGGWIMLLAALQRPDRVAALVGIAAAPDFTEDLMAETLEKDVLRTIEKDGLAELPNPYDPEEPFIITRALLEEGRKHLLLRKPIAVHVPVRLLHGMKDDDVPWQTALRISQMLLSEDVDITFVKEGDHRLSDERDLERLRTTVGGLIDQLSSS